MMSVLLLVSYTVWAAVSFYCLKSYNGKYGQDLMRFAYVTFIIGASNSMLGVIEFCESLCFKLYE